MDCYSQLLNFYCEDISNINTILLLLIIFLKTKIQKLHIIIS